MSAGSGAKDDLEPGAASGAEKRRESGPARSSATLSLDQRRVAQSRALRPAPAAQRRDHMMPGPAECTTSEMTVSTDRLTGAGRDRAQQRRWRTRAAATPAEAAGLMVSAWPPSPPLEMGNCSTPDAVAARRWTRLATDFTDQRSRQHQPRRPAALWRALPPSSRLINHSRQAGGGHRPRRWRWWTIAKPRIVQHVRDRAHERYRGDGGCVGVMSLQTVPYV
jgi:hypothetical protein